MQYCQVDSSGGLSLKQTLAGTGISSFVVSVQLSDQGTVENPDQLAVQEATVRVSVIRNLNPPVFVNNTYRVSVTEGSNLNSLVATVQAQDTDNVS